jgi:hypothetical protein
MWAFESWNCRHPVVNTTCLYEDAWGCYLMSLQLVSELDVDSEMKGYNDKEYKNPVLTRERCEDKDFEKNGDLVSKSKRYRQQNNKKLERRRPIEEEHVNHASSDMALYVLVNEALNAFWSSHSFAASTLSGDALFGSPRRLCSESRMVWTLYTADHLSWRMSRQIAPDARSTFGW